MAATVFSKHSNIGTANKHGLRFLWFKGALEIMWTTKPKEKAMLLVMLMAVVVAAFDYVVRTYTLGWTEASISQMTVFLSPLVYFALFTMGLFKLRTIPTGLSNRSNIAAAVLLVSCSLLVLSQVFIRKQGVGSASYSIVSPLFISGLPLSVLTFSLFFRKTRALKQSYLICLACVFWIVMPVGIDTLYVTQGGYRGPSSIQVAVVSTSYDLIQYIAALSLFIAQITGPVTIFITAYRVFKAKDIERLYSFAVGPSIFALSIQFINWGGFVWD